MPNGATLGQCALLDNVVFCCGRPFKSQEAWLQGWSCQAFRGGVKAARSFYFRKPNSIIKTTGLPLQETASTVGEARWQA